MSSPMRWVDGRTVLLGAADTFRAAAAEQLSTWAGRVGAEVVRLLAGGEFQQRSAVLGERLLHAAGKIERPPGKVVLAVIVGIHQFAQLLIVRKA